MPVSKKPRKHQNRFVRCTVVDRDQLATRCWIAFQLLKDNEGFSQTHYERLGTALNLSGRLADGDDEMKVLEGAAPPMVDMFQRYQQTQQWTLDAEGISLLAAALTLCDEIWARHSPRHLYKEYHDLVDMLRRRGIGAQN